MSLRSVILSLAMSGQLMSPSKTFFLLLFISNISFLFFASYHLSAYITPQFMLSTFSINTLNIKIIILHSLADNSKICVISQYGSKILSP